jgi:hypothetical protein
MGFLVHVTAWERVSRWRRFCGAFGRVAALIALLTVLFDLLGPPIEIFFMARWEARKIPALNVIPRPLTDYSVSNAPGTVLSYFGYRFEVPWNATFKTRGLPKNTDESGWIDLDFGSGQNVLFIVPTDQSGLLSEVAHDQSLRMENSRTALGDLTNRSAYDQYSALLNVTPSAIKAFGPRREAARSMVLLTIKAIAPPGNLATGAFSFQLPGKRGFQIGDPRKSKSVDLEVLDIGGRYVEIICEATKDGVKLTQPELNRILTTLQTAPAGSGAGTLTAERNHAPRKRNSGN